MTSQEIQEVHSVPAKILKQRTIERKNVAKGGSPLLDILNSKMH